LSCRCSAGDLDEASSSEHCFRACIEGGTGHALCSKAGYVDRVALYGRCTVKVGEADGGME
jgi:hypothetical protein